MFNRFNKESEKTVDVEEKKQKNNTKSIIKSIGCLLFSILIVGVSITVFRIARWVLTPSDSHEDELNYSVYEILMYETDRSLDLLEKYNLNEYKREGLKRDYIYTAEDYAKIPELNETYLYGFYIETTTDTVTQICQALGYENINDFLIKTDCVSEGKANILVWREADLIIMDKIMANDKEYNKQK